MSSRLLLLLLLTSATAPAALAQSSTPSATSTTPAAASTAAPAQYGAAFIFYALGGGCTLALQDGVTPNPGFKRYEENGHNKVFADEAAVLNFLAAMGWEITPYGTEDARHYFLKRRAQ